MHASIMILIPLVENNFYFFANVISTATVMAGASKFGVDCGNLFKRMYRKYLVGTHLMTSRFGCTHCRTSNSVSECMPRLSGGNLWG